MWIELVFQNVHFVLQPKNLADIAVLIFYMPEPWDLMKLLFLCCQKMGRSQQTPVKRWMKQAEMVLNLFNYINYQLIKTRITSWFLSIAFKVRH